MEENKIEQPNLETESLGAQNSSETQDGSMFGKFNDAKNLLNAYNNLQAEFTRKSQKLAEFQRKNEENAVFDNSKFDSVDEFLKSTDMEKYKNDVTEIIANDSEISSLPNKYQVALKIAKEAERKSAKMLNDQNFIDENVLNNENIKQKIIKDYLMGINKVSTAPNLIGDNSSLVHFSPNENKPKTIKEAGEIFSKMLK